MSVHLPNTLALTSLPSRIGSIYGIGLFLKSKKIESVRLLTAASWPSGVDAEVHNFWPTLSNQSSSKYSQSINFCRDHGCIFLQDRMTYQLSRSRSDLGMLATNTEHARGEERVY